MACFEIPKKFDRISSSVYDDENDEYDHWTFDFRNSQINDVYLEDYMNRIYLLVNDSGEFSLNGYMYCYINGVILLGISSSFSTYDKNIGCPRSFFVHDLDHTSDMITPQNLVKPSINLYNLDMINNYINPLYYYILNSNLDKNHKEYLIFVIWVAIHEVNDLNLLRVNSIKTPTFNYTNVMKNLDFFELKEEDYDEMSKIGKVGKRELSNPYWGRIAMIHYYYDYIKNNFPTLFKDMGINSNKLI